MKRYKGIAIIFLILLIIWQGYRYAKHINFNTDQRVGQVVDSLNGVYVYFNGGVSHTGDRNLSPDGYNIGMKYQCVEFVKRYYYEYYHHKMPDSYGNAKDFFDKELPDSSYSAKRDLFQYTNGSVAKPDTGDLLIFDGTARNKYGHVVIVSAVYDTSIQIIQQNPGPFAPSRETIGLKNENGKWIIVQGNALGWLRKQAPH